MKKFLSIMLSILMVVTMIPMSVLPASAAEASDSVSYVDYTWNEESKTLSSETKSVDTYTEITSTTTEMTSGWYVVNGEVTVAERMTATGEVHLILADGAHLTASLGITVNEGNSLYIYGQSSDESTMGKLTATATDFDAAIGSLDAYHAGTIVINGGNINASTSKQGAGIGSGATRGGYQITINAGVVTATSGSSPAAIGSGNNRGSGVRGTVHSICINGGVVNATSSGAAIGGGSLFDGGDITITGGTVTAKSVNQGAAIGGGYGGSGGNITITGGTVTATSVKQGAAIGGGYRGSGGNITITGGNVNATYTNSGYYGVAIGAGYYGDSAGNILITGGTVTATSTRGCGIGVYNGDNGRIVILGGTVNASGSGTVHINAGDSGSMMLVDGTTVTISGDFTLQTDFVLPEGYTLEISEGATLTIPEGVTLTLPEEYTLVSNGTVNAVGTVNCITHKYVEGVCICGLECSHVGGTPTCMAPAVCTTCGTGYGEVDPTNHNWENGVCTYGCNTNHEPHDWSGKDGICTVCGATCTHTGGTATCKTQAVCEVCEVSYGELDPDNHEYENNNGFCTECDAYQPATLVTNENYESFYLKADYVGYYAISNAGQLFWYANYINTVDRTANAVLVADIDLENRPWTPIGSTGENSNNFRGIFDGQNHTIKGLYVEGDRAGLGFFGEVRTGTVKSFTIFGEVVVNTEVDYVGGVIGSICGVNGETDLERNGAIIQQINSYVNLTVKAHGVGKIGGFVGYANHQSLIEQCAWYGTFDAGEYRVDSGAGGFIGKIQENTSEVTIRNCGAYGTIKTNYAGDYNDTSTIYMGGFLSFSNTNAKTTIENCLFAGKFERGENLTDQAFLGAFGTLRSVNAIKNCYYLGDDGLEAVHSDSNLKPGSDNVEITKVTGEELKSGKIANQLGELWSQGEDYPILKELSPHSHSYTYTDNGDGTHDMVCTGCGYVVVYNEAHTPADNATYTDNGDGTHSFGCGDCGATVSDNHDFGSGNTCICGAEIAFTGIVVDDENSDEYRYDETRKTYTIIIPADEVGGTGYLSYDIIGTNLTLIEDTNTLLKVQHENEDGLTSAPDDLLVDVLQDNGYFGWSVLGYGDGEWEKLLYSNDGGLNWTTYTFEVKQAYSITVNASQNGTVTANEYAIEGDNIALNVSPAEGYMLDTLSVTDASGNSVDVENNAFTMPASAVTVTATFAVCDHKDGRHETATDNGDGTHDATYSCCGTTVTEPHSTTAEDDKAATCIAPAYCSVCDSEYGEVDADAHVDEDGNEFCDDCGTLIGAKILTSDGEYLYIDGVKAETTGSRQLLPTGNYIPAGDITTSYNVYVKNGESVTLDLNGYTWYSNTLSIDGAFSLYDTSENETGKIASNDEAYTISVRDYGRFSLYSGAVENVNAGPDACAVAAHANVSINLYGGKLKSKVHAVYYSLYSDVTVNLDGTVLECGESHPQFVTDGYSDAPATSVIDVTDYKGGKLAVEIGNSNTTDKITVFTGISSAQEAENYTVQDVFEDDYLNVSIVKTEYDEAKGELSVYLGESTFTQQPTSENNYTVDFNTLDASFLWYEIENPLLTSDNVTASAVFENGKWLCGAGKYIKLFTFDAKAGDILEISSNSSEEFSLDINNEDWTLEENIDITESRSFTVSEDAKLTVWVNAYNVSEDLEIEFSILRIIEELDSETGKTLQNPECLKTYSCQATTKKGYVCSSDAVTVAHNWANLDGICVNGCGTECAHQNETGDICSVCGAVLHTCDFSGEWKYDADKHWKECTADGCDKISEEAEHSYTDGKCDCGYTCPHEKYTDGICDKCDYECPHEWGEGVLTRPTFETDGYYTYTCTLCGHSYTEPAKEADTTALNDASMKVTEYIDNDTLTQEAKDEIYKSYRDILKNNGNVFDEFGFVRGDLVEEDQPAINAVTAELEKIIADADEKIASGEYVKADYTEIDEAIDDIEEKLASENVTDEGKAGLEEIKKQLEEMKADENTSKADLAELEKELEAYEEELDKGIEDGTLVEVDGDKIADDVNKKWAEKLEAEGLLDEYEDFINNQKATDEALAALDEINDFANSLEGTVAENAENIEKINEMMDYVFTSWENCLRGTHNFNDYEVTSPAKCGKNAVETSICWFCGETDEREVEGSALEHSFTKYEVTEEAECGKAGKEVAYCDNGCQTTDEREIPALTHKDDDGDSLCDHGCGTQISSGSNGGTGEAETPDGPEQPEEDETICEHCGGNHSNPITRIFCRITQFFLRLFTFLGYW